MFTHNFFGIAAPVLSVVAFTPYVRAIFKKETKRLQRFLVDLGIFDLIALISSWSAGAPWQVLILPIWLLRL